VPMKKTSTIISSPNRNSAGLIAVHLKYPRPDCTAQRANEKLSPA
jgi:hypothetical protein